MEAAASIAVLLLLAAAGRAGTCPAPALAERMARLADPAGGRVGAAALLVETGERVSTNGRSRFPMQSVYKVPIAMAVLKRVDEGRLRLDARVRVEEADLAPPRVHSPMRGTFPRGGPIEPTLVDLLRMSIDSRADLAAREGVIAAIARAAWDCWTGAAGDGRAAPPTPGARRRSGAPPGP